MTHPPPRGDTDGAPGGTAVAGAAAVVDANTVTATGATTDALADATVVTAAAATGVPVTAAAVATASTHSVADEGVVEESATTLVNGPVPTRADTPHHQLTRPTKTTTPQQRTKAKATVPPKANTPPPKADTPPPSPPPEAWPDSPSAPPSPPEDDTIVLPAPGLKPCTVTVGVQNGSESPTGPTQVETKPGFSCDVGGDSSDSPMASYEYSDDDDFTTCRSSGGVPVSTSRRKRTSTARSRITRRMTHAIKRTRTTYRMTHACTTSAQNEPRVTHARTTCTQELPYMYAYTQTAGRASTPCCGESPQEKTQYRESSSCQDSQGRQGQGQEVDPLLNLPGGQWLPARSQIYDRANMLNKKTTLNSVKPHTNTEGELLPSERKGLRLLQAIISYRDANGVTKTGRVKLDTCSNGCYALPGISLPRPWRPWEPRSVQGIQGTLNALGNPTYFTLYKQGATVTIDTNDPLPGVLPDGCVALLGLDAIHDLGIDIAYAVKHQRHMPIKFISDQGHLVENRRNNAIKQYVEQGYVKESIVKTCNLSERVVKEYLRTHPNDYKSKTIDIRSVDIAIALSKRTQDKLRDLCKLYDMVFASNTNTLPPVLEGIKPHMFKMKEGAKPVYETRPAFPPAKAQAISEWLQWAIDANLVEKASPTCSYASRLILAPKYKGSTPKSAPPDGMRVAWAGVRVNDTIVKAVPTYTDAWQQLYKVANTKYKFSADGLKQYWSIPLCEKAREMTAFWTPQGLFQFKRMVMGTKNAATVAQNAYTNALHNMLHSRSFPNIANFADDFLGGADSEESLIQTFEDFLKMCKKAKITLNPGLTP